MIHAYPNAENAASNRICEKAGFTLRGPIPIEYPAEHWMTCNDWSLDL
jgi:RimJ/RimL family protein N-acetyltransferase